MKNYAIVCFKDRYPLYYYENTTGCTRSMSEAAKMSIHEALDMIEEHDWHYCQAIRIEHAEKEVLIGTEVKDDDEI